jgi:hypothetical protein
MFDLCAPALLIFQSHRVDNRRQIPFSFQPLFACAQMGAEFKDKYQFHQCYLNVIWCGWPEYLYQEYSPNHTEPTHQYPGITKQRVRVLLAR